MTVEFEPLGLKGQYARLRCRIWRLSMVLDQRARDMQEDLRTYLGLGIKD